MRARCSERLAPAVPAERQQRVERRAREGVAQRRDVDGVVAVPPDDTPPGEDAEAAQSIPSARSSSTGSKNEQLPIDRKSVPRVWARTLAPARREPQRKESSSSSNDPAGADRASSSSPKTTAASRLRNPCSPPVG